MAAADEEIYNFWICGTCGGMRREPDDYAAWGENLPEVCGRCRKDMRIVHEPTAEMLRVWRTFGENFNYLPLLDDSA